MLFQEIDDENANLLLDNMDYACYRDVSTMIDNVSEEYDRVQKRIK